MNNPVTTIKRRAAMLTIITLTLPLYFTPCLAWGFFDFFTPIIETISSAVNAIIETVTSIVTTIVETVVNFFNPPQAELPEASVPEPVPTPSTSTLPNTFSSPSSGSGSSSDSTSSSTSSQTSTFSNPPKVNLLSEPLIHYDWKLARSDPGDEWFNPNFNDSSWSEDSLPLTGSGTAWLRRFFTASGRVVLTADADDKATCYLNNNQIFGNNDKYRTSFPSSYWRDVTSMIQDVNILACYFQDFGGDSYFSLSIEGETRPVVPLPENLPLQIQVSARDLSFVEGKPVILDVELLNSHQDTTVTLGDAFLTTSEDVLTWVYAPISGENTLVFDAVDNVDGDSDSFTIFFNAVPFIHLREDYVLSSPFNPAPGDFINNATVTSVTDLGGGYQLLNLSDGSSLVVPLGLTVSCLVVLASLGILFRRDVWSDFSNFVNNFVQGVVLGKSESVEGFAGDIILSAVPLGDSRDIILRIFQELGVDVGQDVDDLTLSLSVIGLGLDVTAFTGVGEAGNVLAGMVKSVWRSLPKSVKTLFLKYGDDAASLSSKLLKVFGDLSASGKLKVSNAGEVVSKYFEKVGKLLGKGIGLDEANEVFVKGFDELDEVIEFASKNPKLVNLVGGELFSSLALKLGDDFTVFLEDYNKIVGKLKNSDSFTKVLFKELGPYYDEMESVPRMKWVESIKGGAPSQISFDGKELQFALDRSKDISKYSEYVIKHELMHPILEKKGIKFYDELIEFGLDHDTALDVENTLLDTIIDKDLLKDPKLAEQIKNYKRTDFEDLLADFSRVKNKGSDFEKVEFTSKSLYFEDVLDKKGMGIFLNDFGDGYIRIYHFLKGVIG